MLKNKSTLSVGHNSWESSGQEDRDGLTVPLYLFEATLAFCQPYHNIAGIDTQ
jgi:hypothetical protein